MQVSDCAYWRCILLFISTEWHCLRFVPPAGLPLNPQKTYEYAEPRWNDADRVKPKKSEKSLSQCHFIHQKYHLYWLGHEPGSPTWWAGDELPEPWHGNGLKAHVFSYCPCSDPEEYEYSCEPTRLGNAAEIRNLELQESLRAGPLKSEESQLGLPFSGSRRKEKPNWTSGRS
jgi:hypothetical protein